MPDRITALVEALEQGRQETITLFSGLSPSELKLTAYQDGARWTVQQVLAHFVTIERSMQWLFRDILAGGQGSPEDFDVERFNQTQPRKLDGCSLDELLGKFEQVRQDTIGLVQGMREQDLDREGRHAFHGHGRLERFIQWAYEHARLHEEDIRRALKTTRP